MAEVYTALELVQSANRYPETELPEDVAEYFNACVLSDIMDVVGVKLTRKENNEIQVKVNERMIDEMKRAFNTFGIRNNVDVDAALDTLDEIKKHIKTTI